MRHFYYILTTPALTECKEFYQRAFEGKLMFEADWYVHIQIGNIELGFLRPNHPRKLPVFQHATLSRGLCLALEVSDVNAEYERLTSKGFEPLGKPQEFPTGEMAFSLMDPAGIVINVIERGRDETMTEV